jgi:hypothetical protein
MVMLMMKCPYIVHSALEMTGCELSFVKCGKE